MIVCPSLPMKRKAVCGFRRSQRGWRVYTSLNRPFKGWFLSLCFEMRSCHDQVGMKSGVIMITNPNNAKKREFVQIYHRFASCLISPNWAILNDPSKKWGQTCAVHNLVNQKLTPWLRKRFCTACLFFIGLTHIENIRANKWVIWKNWHLNLPGRAQ